MNEKDIHNIKKMGYPGVPSFLRQPEKEVDWDKVKDELEGKEVEVHRDGLYKAFTVVLFKLLVNELPLNKLVKILEGVGNVEEEAEKVKKHPFNSLIEEMIKTLCNSEQNQ